MGLLKFLAYAVSTYVGGYVIGMPLGLLLGFLFARRLQPFSVRLNDLAPANGTVPTPEILQAIHLRRTIDVLTGIGCAAGCGLAAAVYIKVTHYSPGNIAQLVFLVSAISFTKFQVLYCLPAVAAFWLGLRLLGA